MCRVTAVRNSSGLYLASLGASANVVSTNFIPVGAPWSRIASIHTVDGVSARPPTT